MENKKIYKYTCKYCGKEFSSHSARSVYCSEQCKKNDNSHKLFPDGTDYVECKICGFRSNQIYRHIETCHKISIEDYCSTYNIKYENLFSNSSHDKMSNGQKKVIAEGRGHTFTSENNPSKSKECKDGRNSIWSMNFKGYDGLTDAEKKLKIKQLSENSRKTMNDNSNNPKRLDYYTSRGFTEKEARTILKESQRTFSLGKCILKYGIQKGTDIFNRRQERWQNTLNSKPPEEIERICKAKMGNGFGWSKKSQLLFKEIYKNIMNEYKEIYFATIKSDVGNDEFMVLNPAAHTHYFLDFYVKDNNKVIEFDGDYWHGEKEEINNVIK